jgi:diketogulonate reductase-like aldo/keto reductase
MQRKTMIDSLSRRRVITGAAALAASAATGLARSASTAGGAIEHGSEQMPVLHKEIPVSGEAIAPVGMGTWITFNIGDDQAARAQRAEVLRAFFQAGGGMIDSSPMYGSAQDVLGDLLTRLSPEQLFSATKVWTGGDGREQIQESYQLWQRNRFDLLQVHNLLNWTEHLALLREMKEDGRIRYLGITTSHGRRHADMEKIIKQHPLDFIQLTYNAVDREAEQRLLPLAQDKGIAVIANRPFQRGALPQALANVELPAVAADLNCTTWAELLLKFIVAHPAVTCVIPATSRVDHMVENMRAGTGPVPDAKQREQIVQAVRNS